MLVKNCRDNCDKNKSEVCLECKRLKEKCYQSKGKD